MRANELIECDLNDVRFTGTAPFLTEKTYSRPRSPSRTTYVNSNDLPAELGGTLDGENHALHPMSAYQDW